MINSKKIVIASMIFINNYAVFAGAVSAQTIEKWTIGGHALYVQTYVGNNGLETTQYAKEQNPPTVSWLGLDPGYSFGFQLEGAYHLTDDNDVSINWYRVRYAASDTHYLQQPGDWPAPFSIYGQATLSSGDTTVKINNQWDAVNFEYGHRFSVVSHDNLRIHAGAQYARIADTTFFSGQQNFSGADQLRQLNFQPTYNGFGPRFGLDLTHNFEHHITAYINGAVGVLAGCNTAEASLSRVGNNLTTDVNNMLIVPEIDGKLGMIYSHPLDQGELSMDVGWLWVNYVDALTAPVYPATLGNFGAQGVYFGLKWSVV